MMMAAGIASTDGVLGVGMAGVSKLQIRDGPIWHPRDFIRFQGKCRAQHAHEKHRSQYGSEFFSQRVRPPLFVLPYLQYNRVTINQALC